MSATQMPPAPHTRGGQHWSLLVHIPHVPLLQGWPPQSLHVVHTVDPGQVGVRLKIDSS
jgi:hypothetical protein